MINKGFLFLLSAFFVIFFIIFGFGVSSFGANPPAANITKTEVSKNKSVKIYPYALKRDPFQSFVYGNGSGLSISGLPLDRYSLGSLKIIGIMESRGRYYALVQTPDKRSYIITDGSIMGIERGRVVYINANSVTVAESVPNAIGRMHLIYVVLKLA